ncbi:MAG: DUF962 domain-containing protein [Bacillota bacterium]|nr:MAG: DUF962 domain-containing protein [Bacillota bacterium]HIA27160.1 DUF962 domain-containing protein [Planctomycetota bacterium]
MTEAPPSPEDSGSVGSWIDRYRADHNHPLNHLTHFIGIPAIVASLVVVFFNWQWGVGLFVGGWILQFIGHGIEGNKPSFMKDPRFLLIGPLFIIQEGFRKLIGKSTPPAKD